MNPNPGEMETRRNTELAQRLGPVLAPDRTRVLIRSFRPGSEELARRIAARVLAMPEEDVSRLLQSVLREFGGRHEFIQDFLQQRFQQVRPYVDAGAALSPERQLLLGAYFTHEYSLEAAALFNPSIVPHPDQSDVPPGGLRFILSLRAAGEGHISSITFRVGLLQADDKITLQPPLPYVTEPERVSNATYEKALFVRKLCEAGIETASCQRLLGGLGDHFTPDELRAATDAAHAQANPADVALEHALRAVLLLAESNYELRFNPSRRISDRIIFPTAPSQSNGIEDARFVRFQDDDGTVTYYATYTAYDGKIILPQLLETPDFAHFRFITLNGPAVHNKGMALFPRKIRGLYAMLSRQDDENLFLTYSDHPHFWYEPKLLLQPAEPWELIKIGNCGSPIETEAGWLVLTHGVGPMRKYCLGACLLDLDDPSRVIGRLRQPLLSPDQTEREGYVPNVVYTCGALLHGRTLLIPYSMSDYATSFAKVAIDDLLATMT